MHFIKTISFFIINLLIISDLFISGKALSALAPSSTVLQRRDEGNLSAKTLNSNDSDSSDQIETNRDSQSDDVSVAEALNNRFTWMFVVLLFLSLLFFLLFFVAGLQYYGILFAGMGFGIIATICLIRAIVTFKREYFHNPNDVALEEVQHSYEYSQNNQSLGATDSNLKRKKYALLSLLFVLLGMMALSIMIAGLVSSLGYGSFLFEASLICNVVCFLVAFIFFRERSRSKGLEGIVQTDAIAGHVRSTPLLTQIKKDRRFALLFFLMGVISLVGLICCILFVFNQSLLVLEITLVWTIAFFILALRSILHSRRYSRDIANNAASIDMPSSLDSGVSASDVDLMRMNKYFSKKSKTYKILTVLFFLTGMAALIVSSLTFTPFISSSFFIFEILLVLGVALLFLGAMSLRSFRQYKAFKKIKNNPIRDYIDIVQQQKAIDLKWTFTFFVIALLLLSAVIVMFLLFSYNSLFIFEILIVLSVALFMLASSILLKSHTPVAFPGALIRANIQDILRNSNRFNKLKNQNRSMSARLIFVFLILGLISLIGIVLIVILSWESMFLFMILVMSLIVLSFFFFLLSFICLIIFIVSGKFSSMGDPSGAGIVPGGASIVVTTTHAYAHSLISRTENATASDEQRPSGTTENATASDEQRPTITNENATASDEQRPSGTTENATPSDEQRPTITTENATPSDERHPTSTTATETPSDEHRPTGTNETETPSDEQRPTGTNENATAFDEQHPTITNENATPSDEQRPTITNENATPSDDRVLNDGARDNSQEMSEYVSRKSKIYKTLTIIFVLTGITALIVSTLIVTNIIFSSFFIFEILLVFGVGLLSLGVMSLRSFRKYEAFKKISDKVDSSEFLPSYTEMLQKERTMDLKWTLTSFVVALLLLSAGIVPFLLSPYISFIAFEILLIFAIAFFMLTVLMFLKSRTATSFPGKFFDDTIRNKGRDIITEMNNQNRSQYALATGVFLFVGLIALTVIVLIVIFSWEWMFLFMSVMISLSIFTFFFFVLALLSLILFMVKKSARVDFQGTLSTDREEIQGDATPSTAKTSDLDPHLKKEEGINDLDAGDHSSKMKDHFSKKSKIYEILTVVFFLAGMVALIVSSLIFTLLISSSFFIFEILLVLGIVLLFLGMMSLRSFRQYEAFKQIIDKGDERSSLLSYTDIVQEQRSMDLKWTLISFVMALLLLISVAVIFLVTPYSGVVILEILLIFSVSFFLLAGLIFLSRSFPVSLPKNFLIKQNIKNKVIDIKNHLSNQNRSGYALLTALFLFVGLIALIGIVLTVMFSWEWIFLFMDLMKGLIIFTLFLFVLSLISLILFIMKNRFRLDFQGIVSNPEGQRQSDATPLTATISEYDSPLEHTFVRNDDQSDSLSGAKDDSLKKKRLAWIGVVCLIFGVVLLIVALNSFFLLTQTYLISIINSFSFSLIFFVIGLILLIRNKSYKMVFQKKSETLPLAAFSEHSHQHFSFIEMFSKDDLRFFEGMEGSLIPNLRDVDASIKEHLSKYSQLFPVKLTTDDLAKSLIFISLMEDNSWIFNSIYRDLVWIQTLPMRKKEKLRPLIRIFNTIIDNHSILKKEIQKNKSENEDFELFYKSFNIYQDNDFSHPIEDKPETRRVVLDLSRFIANSQKLLSSS